MSILYNILIISLFCNGWYLITHDGMIFDFLRKWYLEIAGGLEHASGTVYWSKNCDGGPAYNRVLKFLYNPLFGCIICMSSIWGSLIYWILFYKLAWMSLVLWPVVIVSAACVNLFIYNLWNK
jgi:hypothetical protein